MRPGPDGPGRPGRDRRAPGRWGRDPVANRGRISAQRATAHPPARRRPDRRRPGHDRVQPDLGKEFEQAEGEPVAGGPTRRRRPRDVAKGRASSRWPWLIPGLTGAIEVALPSTASSSGPTSRCPASSPSPPSSRRPSHSRAGSRSRAARCIGAAPVRDGGPRRPRDREGVAITGPRPMTRRVCAARSSALSQVRNAVSAPCRPTRADATRLLDDGEPLSCPTADPDIPDVLSPRTSAAPFAVPLEAKPARSE